MTRFNATDRRVERRLSQQTQDRVHGGNEAPWLVMMLWEKALNPLLQPQQPSSRCALVERHRRRQRLNRHFKHDACSNVLIAVLSGTIQLSSSRAQQAPTQTKLHCQLVRTTIDMRQVIIVASGHKRHARIQAHSHTHMQADSQQHRHIYTSTHTSTHTSRLTTTQAHIQADSQQHRKIEIQPDIKTDTYAL